MISDVDCSQRLSADLAVYAGRVVESVYDVINTVDLVWSYSLYTMSDRPRA